MNPYEVFSQRPDYENPEVLSRSRLPAHTRFGAYASVREALRGDIRESSNILWLDGDYRFKLYDRPEAVEPFWQEDFDDSAWGGIAVPEARAQPAPHPAGEPHRLLPPHLPPARALCGPPPDPAL